MIQIAELEFDDGNRQHLKDRGRLDENTIVDVFAGNPVYAQNEPSDDRSGSHLMIGPDTTGTLWTIVIVCVDEQAGVWRPITGWPTERKKEVALWQGRS